MAIIPLLKRPAREIIEVSPADLQPPKPSALTERVLELLGEPGEWREELLSLVHSSGLKLTTHASHYALTATIQLDGDTIVLSTDDWLAIRAAYRSCRAAVVAATERRILDKLG